MSDEKKFTPKQKAFIQEYLIDLNATQAAIRAGYSAKTADAAASRLLVDVKIAEEIQRAVKDRSERTEITQDRVIREIARLGFSDPRKLFDASGTMKSIHDLDDDTAASIAGIDISISNDGETTIKKIKMWDKNSALEKLAKHLQLFTERVEVEMNKPIQVNVSGPGFPPIPSSIFDWEQQMKEYLEKQKSKETDDENNEK